MSTCGAMTLSLTTAEHIASIKVLVRGLRQAEDANFLMYNIEDG